MGLASEPQWDSPQTKAAEKYVIETAIKMGKRPRVEVDTWEQAKPYLDMGVKDFCPGWDVSVIYDYCKRQGEALAKLLGR